MPHYEWDDIKTKGFSNLLYKLYLGLTYPVRHPFVTIVVLLAFYRHELSNMWLKYQHKMPEPVQQAAIIKKQTTDKIEEKLSELRSSLGEIVRNVHPASALKPEKKEPAPNWNTIKFNKVKYEPLNADNKELELTEPEEKRPEAKVQTETDITPPDNFIAEDSENPAQSYSFENIDGYYRKNDNLHLEYLKTPQQIFGEAEIAGANSLYIDGKFMFLYGVYTDPNFYSEEIATAYLQQITDGQIVRCEIVAKTYNQTATALCFVNGEFINKALVNKKMARNVALQ